MECFSYMNVSIAWLLKIVIDWYHVSYSILHILIGERVGLNVKSVKWLIYVAIATVSDSLSSKVLWFYEQDMCQQSQVSTAEESLA